ncbi:MAG: PilZ domain-containing protein [Candidatus Omnitrophota bacterium]
MYEERRKYRRVEFKEPLQYQTQDGDSLEGSLACDIGEGGVRFNADDFIPLNSELAVQMEIEPQNVVALRGRVAWVQLVPHSDRYQVGLEFDGSESCAESREKIHQYVASLRS